MLKDAPEKPITLPHFTGEGYKVDGTHAHCPMCGQDLNNFLEMPHCPICGQMIDWSEMPACLQ